MDLQHEDQSRRQVKAQVWEELRAWRQTSCSWRGRQQQRSEALPSPTERKHSHFGMGDLTSGAEGLRQQCPRVEKIHPEWRGSTQSALGCCIL